MNSTNLTEESGFMANTGVCSKTEVYVMVVIMTVLAAVGTAGNALVIYVFHMKQDRLISTFFIITLGIVDFFTCLIVIPFTIYMEYIDYSITYDFPCKVYYFLITCNIILSILLMVAIAIDRYFCICHPFLNALNMTRAKILTAIMSLFAAALGISVSIQHGIVYYDLNAAAENGTFASNRTMQVMQSQNKSEEDFDVTPYCSQLPDSFTFIWFFQKCYFAMYFHALLIVIILYSLIYYSVHARRSARARQRSTALPLVQNTNGSNANETQHEAHRNKETADRIANIKTALNALRGDRSIHGDHYA